MRKPLKRAAAAALLVSFAAFATPAAADLQSAMDNIFNSMANVSKPGVYDGIRRGVISGGEVTVKNRIVNQNILTFVPPSWEAGCGGINLFTGSFSYINSEQLIQLMRSIASNAAGLAFKLALDSMSSLIGMNVSDFLSQVEEMNRFFSNSCYAAQQIVDTAQVALERSAENISTAAGSASDTHEARQADAVALAKDTDDFKAKVGNLIYRSLAEQDVKTWFAGGDTDSYEEIMSLTGTVILTVGDKEDGKTKINVTTIPHSLSLTDLVEGGSALNLLKCENGGNNDMSKACTEVARKQENITPLSERISEVLIGNYSGTNSVGGIVHKFRVQSEEPTDIEKNVIASTGRIGAFIQQLAVRDEYIAAEFVRQNAKIISIELTSSLIDELFSATKAALSKNKSEHVFKAYELIDEARSRLSSEIHLLQSKYGKAADLEESYLRLRKLLPEDYQGSLHGR